MAVPNSKATLIQYCKRQLGFPVVEINVDDDQADDVIDDSLQFFTEYHYDGTIRTYLKHLITQAEIDNQLTNSTLTSSTQGGSDNGATNWLEGNNYIELIENRGLSSLRITENASAETKTMDDIREEMAALQNTVLSKSPIELFLWFQDLFDPERTLPWDTLSETDNQSILQDMLLIQEDGFPELLESAQPEVNVDVLLNNPIFTNLFIE